MSKEGRPNLPARRAVFAIAILTAAIATASTALAPRSPTPKLSESPIRTTVVAKGLEHPWGLAFLPDGSMLVTERAGRLRLIDKDGQLGKPLAGVPQTQVAGQGGLLDVTVSPTFAQDRLIYLSYAEPGEGGAGTAVARARLGDQKLDDLQVIWRQVPKVSGSNHWGSRLVFARDGKLFITTGDRFAHRERAQDLSTTIGKVVRINADGSIPQDNPFVKRDGARPEIWSYGHRNIQAAALHPQTGQLWTIEHGARGGDELNNPQAGKNYGWPVITYGIDYSGAKIGEGQAKDGMEQPAYYWDPVIAPSGATFYTGDTFPEWRGSLFIGSLRTSALVRLAMNGDRVTAEERYLGDSGRIREVVQGPDGLLYLLTDESNGRVLRVEPVKAR